MIRVKKDNGKAVITIHGMIIDDTDATWLSHDANGAIGYTWPDEVKNELDGLAGMPIELHVASDGGDVAAGICIYNMLKAHDAEVVAYIDSWAASIASVICMAASKIFMPSNTFLMIHNPVGGAYGEAEYLKAVAEWLGKLKTMIADTYAGRAKDGKDAKFFLEKMDAETWFSAKEAADIWNGIEVTDSTDVEAVAVFSQEKNAPDAVNALKIAERKEAEARAKEQAEAEAKAKAEAEAKAKAEADLKLRSDLINVLREAYSYEEKN